MTPIADRWYRVPVTVTVTPHHIALATPRDCLACAIAIAFHDALRSLPHIAVWPSLTGQERVVIDGRPSKLPEALNTLALMLDRGEAVDVSEPVSAVVECELPGWDVERFCWMNNVPVPASYQLDVSIERNLALGRLPEAA